MEPSDDINRVCLPGPSIQTVELFVETNEGKRDMDSVWFQKQLYKKCKLTFPSRTTSILDILVGFAKDTVTSPRTKDDCASFPVPCRWPSKMPELFLRNITGSVRRMESGGDMKWKVFPHCAEFRQIRRKIRRLCNPPRRPPRKKKTCQSPLGSFPSLMFIATRTIFRSARHGSYTVATFSALIKRICHWLLTKSKFRVRSSHGIWTPRFLVCYETMLCYHWVLFIEYLYDF